MPGRASSSTLDADEGGTDLEVIPHLADAGSHFLLGRRTPFDARQFHLRREAGPGAGHAHCGAVATPVVGRPVSFSPPPRPPRLQTGCLLPTRWQQGHGAVSHGTLRGAGAALLVARLPGAAGAGGARLPPALLLLFAGRGEPPCLLALRAQDPLSPAAHP